MKRVILALVCAAVATSYPTDNKITEPPNIVFPERNDVDNVVALTEAREPEKRSAEQDKPPDGQQPSSRIYVRLGRGGSMDSPAEMDLAGEKDASVFRLGSRGKSNDNFVRLGRGGSNNFVRFGRGKKQDNFIRFGRDRTDNFIRLGRGNSDNFIRFGRGGQNKFIRFGRGEKENLFEFERNTKNSRDLEDTDVSSDEELFTNSNLRVGCCEEPDRNFVPFSMLNRFNQLNRGSDEVADAEERGKAKSNFLRFGRQIYEDNFVRDSRSLTNNDLRRGKLSDRNFIRFGRSDQQHNDNREEEDSGETEERLGRSNQPGNNQNFIRLGKRLEASDKHEEIVRFGRDVGHQQDLRSVLTGDSPQSDIKNSMQYVRSTRSVTFSDEDGTPKDSSDYPDTIAKSALDEDKMLSTNDDSQKPFRYYSLLASGIPNYISGPEL